MSFADTAKAVFGSRHTDHTGTPQGYLNGKVNEARVYRTGLTAAQVAALYAAGPDRIPQMRPSDTSKSVGPGASFLFFSVCMVAQAAFVWKVLPETKGVSLEQLQKRLGIE